MSKYIVTDGMKSIDFPAYPDAAWTFMTNPPQGADAHLYAKVAAVFRAVNLSADAVANLPFAIMRGDEDIDTSDNWTNAVGFLPDPKELLRLWRISLFMTGTAYGRYGRNMAGKAKNLYYAVPTTITANYDNNGDVKDFTRTVGSNVTTLKPIKDLIYIWRKGWETEVKPSENTEFSALSGSAGIMYHADYFIKNYFERGGVKPTLIGLKGVTSKENKEEMEKGVSEWIRNVSKRVAKLFNAEQVDVKTIGDGVADLKDNATYRQAIENVAMVSGIPLSLLLSNSANWATAQMDYMQWYRDSVTPWANFMAGALNEQVFIPLGMRLVFRPEMTDPNQEEEVNKASAFSTYLTAFRENGTDKPASLAAQIVGIELPPGMEYDSLDPVVKPEPVAPPVVVPDPITETAAPVKWTPNIEQLREMELWQNFAFRKFRKSASLDFPFEVKTLPAYIAVQIRDSLIAATDEAQIKAAFDVSGETETTAPEYKSDIIMLAMAINKLAESKGHE